MDSGGAPRPRGLAPVLCVRDASCGGGQEQAERRPRVVRVQAPAAPMPAGAAAVRH